MGDRVRCRALLPLIEAPDPVFCSSLLFFKCSGGFELVS